MSTVPTNLHPRPPRPLPPEPLSPLRQKLLQPPTTPSGPRPNPSSTSKISGANTQTTLAPPKTPSPITKTPHHSRFRSSSPLPPVVEGDARLLRDVRGPLPGDSGTNVRRRGSSPALQKQRSAYFEREFGQGTKDGDVVRGRSVVVAEVKTNVFVKDEPAFVQTLSEHLTHRYTRPLSSIAVSLQHGVCLLMGGTFDPAYIITIHAIPSLVQTATNKRNAALLQKSLEMTLNVRSDRGVVRFVPVAEDCLARGGRTVAGDLGEGEAGERVTRRRTIRTFSRLKPGSGSTSQASPPPPVPTLNQNRTHERSSSVNSAQVDGSRPSVQIEGSRPDDGGSPKGKGLKHKRSMGFVQSLFRRGSKVDKGAGREADIVERGEVKG